MDSMYSSFGLIIGILFVVLLISLLTSAIKISRTNSVQRRVEIVWVEKLLQNIGRKEVSFPVLLYGWIWAEVSFLKNLNDLIAQNWTSATSIIDATNKQYTIHRYAVNQMIHATNTLVSLEEVRFEKELSFNLIKDRIITDIRVEGSSSCYENVLANLEDTTSVEELIWELQKWVW